MHCTVVLELINANRSSSARHDFLIALIAVRVTDVTLTPWLLSYLLSYLLSHQTDIQQKHLTVHLETKSS